MTVKIHKFSKTLENLNNINISMSNTTGMVITHYLDSVKSSGATLNFEFEGIKQHIPNIEDIEFCIAIKKEIDLTSFGPNVKEQMDIGLDIGKYNNVSSKPYRPLDLPTGFVELYKKE